MPAPYHSVFYRPDAFPADTTAAHVTKQYHSVPVMSVRNSTIDFAIGS